MKLNNPLTYVSGTAVSTCIPDRTENDSQPCFTNKTVDELAKWLEPVVKRNRITLNVVHKFIEEKIDGKAFEHMNKDELHELVPDLKWGEYKNLLVDRDDEISRSKSEKKASASNCGIVEEPEKEERLRTFKHCRKRGDRYRYAATVPEMESRITDKITPIHKFVDLQVNKDKHIMQKIVTDMVFFASACMNERTNGTIHFGIKDGKIVGIPLDNVKCSKACTEGIRQYFFEDQVAMAMRCIRPPIFIPVLGSKYQNAHVVEIDVFPSSNIISNEGFFVKSSDSSDEWRLFRINEDGCDVEIKGPNIQCFMQEKSALTSQREAAEKGASNQRTPKPDIRRELKDFLCNGGEYVEGDVYPLLFANSVDEAMDNAYLKDNFEFLKWLDIRAFFDFDHRDSCNTLAGFLLDQDEVYMTRLVDEFDDNRDKTKKRQILETLEDINESARKTWIYCNGHEPSNISPLGVRDWTKEKTKGFGEILRFYKDQIPQDRARVIILLLSKEFDVISEAIREISLTFQEQWIVLAANEGIADTWRDLMLKCHSTCFDREMLDSKCLVMSWELFNQTILQLTGTKKSSTCQIPSAKGVFIDITNKLQNKLCDIEILSRNECENEMVNEILNAKHRRKVEEDFYRGLQVSWWNFYYQGQVLLRKDHSDFRSQIVNALNGNLEYGEKIAMAKIYHQPGAGGTTSARQILWDLRSQYPCCCIKKITKETAVQIQKMRTLATDDCPKPPLILLDNEDDECMENLVDDLTKIAKNENCQVFCLILLCCRQVRLPFEKCPVRMTLKQELSSDEILWFEQKNKELHKDRTGLNPRVLIAFNIMKSNFSKDSIQKATKKFVDTIPDRERKLLLYLAFVNSFDLDFQPLPVSCFDSLMCTKLHEKTTGKRWEQRLEESIRILLNRTQIPYFMGGKVLSIRIISPLLSREILNYLMEIKSLDLAEIACDFLESRLFKKKDVANRILFKTAASLMKKRRWVIKTAEGNNKPVQEFLSPLLQDIYNAKNECGAVKVVELAFDILEDPMIAQQAARLHMDLGNLKRGEQLIEEAIRMSPNNSFLQHTYGTLYRTQLQQIYKKGIDNKETGRLTLEETKASLRFAKNAIDRYQKVEDITKQGSHGSSENPFGLIGILQTVIYLLDTLTISKCFQTAEELHNFLVKKEFCTSDSNMLGEDFNFLKSLEKRVDEIVDTLESDLNCVIADRRTEQKAILSFVSAGRMGNLKIRLNNYFGESKDELPLESFSEDEKAEFRRRRSKSLGFTSLTGIIKHKQDDANVFKVLNHVRTNIEDNRGRAVDFIVAIACLLKLECCSDSKQSSSIPFSICQKWSKTFYEMDKNSSKSSIEASLFLVLLNWPQSAEFDNPVNHSLLKASMDCLIRHSLSKGKRKREKPLFFIGKEAEYKRVFRLPEKLSSKNPFRDIIALKRIRRFDGCLRSGGNEVSVSFQSSSNPSPLLINIPLEGPNPDKTEWNKRVTFVVGLGKSGIHAYDVTTDNLDEIKKNIYEMQCDQHETLIQEQQLIASDSVSTNQDSDGTEQLLQRLKFVSNELRKFQPLDKVISYSNKLLVPY